MASSNSDQIRLASSPTEWDVFLSFRGIDTRHTFSDHLYDALDSMGIKTFRDTPELQSGQVIARALPDAIKISKTYIVILSENYGSSRWCLDELVEIFDYSETMQRLVIPVFYKIEPSVVQYRKGKFAEAFEKHATRYDIYTLAKWRVALDKVGKISGYTVREKMYETDFIKEIVDRILFEINPKTLDVPKYPVGLDSRVEDITALFRRDSCEDAKKFIRIGIHGMAGVGKTTLAIAVFNQNYHRFQGSCFLANVREESKTEKGKVCLQQQLVDNILKRKNDKIDNVQSGIELIRSRICSRKVLIVVDDLDDPSPLEFLEGPFHLGSIIIVTTRNEDLLDKIKAEAKYKVNELGNAESRELFTQHAFGEKLISDKFVELSKDILAGAEGLPLALKVYGNKFFNQEEKRWNGIIDSFKRVSYALLEDRLRISYDTLELVDPILQNIFLDIACLFIGHDEEEVVRIMKTCYEVVNDKIDLLMKRSLLRIDEKDKVGMHRLLRDMGREIACNNSPRKPEKHSRLWVSEKICHVLTRLKGTEAIEGIISHNDLCSQHAQEEASFSTEAFKSMSNLRFLYLNKVKLTGSFKQTFEDVTWLCWKFCPLKYLPSEFLPQKLVILALPRSKMRTMWEVPQDFQESKSLNMPASLNFTTIPKFTEFEYLETLDLEGSESLEEIHISSKSFKRLVSLNLCGCVSLRSLGESISGLKALKVLNIGKCPTLEALPTKLGDIDSLEVLNAEGLTVLKLPDSIGRLRKLVELKLRCNTNLKTLPDTICDLSALKILDIGYCEKLEALPNKLGNIKSLEELKAEGLTVLEIPNSIRHLSKLVELRLRCNKKLKTLPEAICDLSALKILDIGYCQGLRALPRELGNIKSLKELNAEGLTVSTLPNSIGYLNNLVVLRLSYNENLETLPETICHMISLEILDICRRKKMVKLTRSSSSTPSKKLLELEASEGASETVPIALPSGVSSWCTKAQNLDLKDCGRLVSIAELPPNLKRISADGCLSIEFFSNLCNLKQLEILNLTGCSGLKGIQGLEKLTSIKILHLTGCSSALLACVCTKRLLQIYSGFGHQVKIYTSEFPKWIEKSSNLASKEFSDLQPNTSSVFGGTILCFKVSKTNSITYSVKSTTRDFTWSDRSYNSYRKSLMVIIPRSIFSIENGDVRIEATSEDAEIHGLHLLYQMADEYHNTTMNGEEVVLLNS